MLLLELFHERNDYEHIKFSIKLIKKEKENGKITRIAGCRARS